MPVRVPLRGPWRIESRSLDACQQSGYLIEESAFVGVGKSPANIFQIHPFDLNDLGVVIRNLATSAF